MPAQYPTSVKSFTVKKDFVDTVDASDPNSVQDEVIAIEQTLGVTPHVSTAPSPTGTWNPASTSFASVAARLANIEQGIVGDTHTQYAHLKGGDVITSSAVGVVGLTWKAMAGQTANFVEFRAAGSGNALLAALSVLGGLTVTSVTSTGAVTAAPGQVIGASVPIAFHVSGILTAGVKIAKFIAPVPLTLRSSYAICDGGGGATFRVRVNGATPSDMTVSPSVGTSLVAHDFNDLAIDAGARVQIEVVATGTANDLSVTIDAVTR